LIRKCLILERETGFEPATLSLGIVPRDSGPGRPALQPLGSFGESLERAPARLGPDRDVSALASGNLPARTARLRGIAGGVDNLLSVREVAARLGVTTATVYKLAARRELPHVRILNAIRVAPADLARFIDEGRRNGPTSRRGSRS
jgi:excisionase family DNA binding protein